MKFIKNPKKQFLFFVLAFFIINFIQSYFTELLDDEAYYWVWSKHLAFGYFDHPPLVALWIKISALFFNGELGVRFFSNISFSLMLLFIWLCISDNRKWQYVWLYFLLIVSTALLNMYGFLALPDTPLFLFISIFLFAYKRYLQSNSLKYTLFLGFAMAGMLYSKYHGILILLFIILSNLKLLKTNRFWIAGVFGFLLFVPHILWQWHFDFPSIKYHLFERSKKEYRIDFTLMHFVNLIAIVGLTFPIIYKAFLKQKINNVFDKGLKYIVWGFIIFFFFSTFKTSTQAQWTAPILIPLIILSFSYFIDHKNDRKWLITLGLSNLTLMIVMRLFIASSTLSPFNFETHGNKIWAEKIKEKTNDRPIVFIGSYKNASKYNFYSGVQTHTYSSLKTRKSQYDLYNFEHDVQHKNVTIEGDKINGYNLYEKGNNIYYAENIDDYITFQKVRCFIEKPQLVFNSGKKEVVEIEIYNPYTKIVNFNSVKFVGVFQARKNAIIKEIPLVLDPDFSLEPQEKKLVRANFIMPKIKSSENITFRVALKFYQLPSGFQGNKVNVILK
jgi:hypothetical protein